MAQHSPFLHQFHCRCQIAACLETALSVTKLCVSLLPLSDTTLLSALSHLKCHCSPGLQSTLHARNIVQSQLSQLQQVELVPALAQPVLHKLLQKGLSSVCFWVAHDEISSSFGKSSECNCSPTQIVLPLGSASVCKALLLAQHAHQRPTESAAVPNCVKLVSTSSWPLHQTNPGSLTAYRI